MPLTAAEKRDRRANATSDERRAEADRGKRRRDQQTEATKQHDRGRRQRRRKEIMTAALEDDDAANASLDLAAARAHWHRLRKQQEADSDERALAKMHAKRAEKAQATKEARHEKAELRRLQKLEQQRIKAVHIANAQVKYEARRQRAADRKQECDELKRQMRESSEASRAWFAASSAHLKAADASSRAGYAMRRLPKAPVHLVREARDGAAWASELQGASVDGQASASRVLPSLARQAPVRRAEALKGEKGKGGIEYASYYHRAVEMEVTVPVGRKSAPASGMLVQSIPVIREPPAWQRAEQVLFESEWHCDVAGPGCLRPSFEAPEPPRPYNRWECVECEAAFVMCGACHSANGHAHPHALRLYRNMPWED